MNPDIVLNKTGTIRRSIQRIMEEYEGKDAAKLVLRRTTEPQSKAMVDFRKIAIHDYQTVQIGIVKTMIDKHLSDFTDFAKKLKDYMSR
ncbi:uncharacterized protein with HEPN domain [Paenibacillus forsythiae]|uniref:Uncharacterized protein with HEPN domain n=1 Tax=Paenibacillus forsythiae TaxID=365616 RepID=A0ABU3H5T1_9BACL|nr:HepT-like ribonuclease domain-containing protein [Paenibacillus forsythiae]MDT3426177.1 uncharacterized protein with HEPN domain [Paenibacillus forsythiae]